MNSQTTAVSGMSAAGRNPGTDPRRLAGRLAWPGDAAYQAAQPWNRAVTSQPRAVVHAQRADDVVGAIDFARAQGLRVAVRSTGHGAFPIGDDVLLVHTIGLDECVVHAGQGWARVGAGLLWQQLIDAAAPHGLAPVCGSAPQIGVAGFLTGGGIGPMARSFGVGSDRVRAMEVVTGQGELLRATPTEHEDLFWGLRGGKGTLGIVTAIELDLIPVVDFYGGSLWFNRADTERVLHGWRQLCERLPDAGTTSAAIMQLPPLPDLPAPIAGRQTLSVRFAWTDDVQAGAQWLEPLRQLAVPVLDDIRVRSYTEIGQVHNDPVEPMPAREHSALLHSVTRETIEALLTALNRDRNAQGIVELRLLGGAVSRRPRQRSAVCHRDAAYTLFMSGVPAPTTTAIDAQATRILDSLSPWTTDGLWTNFERSADRDVIARCYDAGTLHRLSALGDEYDPDGVLRLGQVVRDASALRATAHTAAKR
jgi:FAD binding domain